MKVTQTEQDFLCVGPFAWARFKSPAQAYRSCKAHAHIAKGTTPLFEIWRLCDQVDQITVSDNGSWTIDTTIGCTMDDLREAIKDGQPVKTKIWSGGVNPKGMPEA